MIWTAALYFAASPSPGSSIPIFLLTVLQPASASAAAASTTILEDMAIVLLETDGLLERAAPARSRGRHGRSAADRNDHSGRRRRDRLNERRGRRRHAGIGPPVQQQIGFVGRADAVGRHLQRARR